MAAGLSQGARTELGAHRPDRQRTLPSEWPGLRDQLPLVQPQRLAAEKRYSYSCAPMQSSQREVDLHDLNRI